MWRRVYLLLLLVRIFFAFCPSYIHPDEIFQGPEVLAGHLFSYPSHRTWEWTVAQPIRSVYPLWLFYGLPMTLLKWIWAEDAQGTVSPDAIYYTLRVVMFIISFVLEDWAIHELVHSPRYRQQAINLVASSYVTWTFQTHTFSNSIETLLVLWSLVLIERIADEKKRSSIPSSMILGFLIVLGTFNRVTFPAFVLIPGIRLLPHFLNKPLCFLAISISGIFWTYIAVATDTAFYTGPAATASFRALFSYMRNAPIMTPLNNLRYNSQTSNLAQHGLHPHYQHFLVNIPQLLGPALILLINSARPFSRHTFKAMLSNPRFSSAAAGTLILSLIPHQEARFLLPCIPLFLTCIRLPNAEKWRRTFWVSWVAFNLVMSLLMGVYHQGGVIPAQIEMPKLVAASTSNSPQAEVFWWKTYPPPTYLLGLPPVNLHIQKPVEITTTPVMGIRQTELLEKLAASVEKHEPSCDSSLLDFLPRLSKPCDTYLAAPFSAWRLGEALPPTSNFTFSLNASNETIGMEFTHLRTFAKHLNLDDMDFGDDGIIETLGRVVGRRGLGVWRVGRSCPER